MSYSQCGPTAPTTTGRQVRSRLRGSAACALQSGLEASANFDHRRAVRAGARRERQHGLPTDHRVAHPPNILKMEEFLRGAGWFVAAVAAAVIGADVLGTVVDRRATSSRLKKIRRGDRVAFEGCVLGGAAYAKGARGFLVIEGDKLQWALDGGRLQLVEIPTERLELVDVTPARKTTEPRMPRSWHVAHCRDGQAEILIACRSDEMTEVRRLLERR